MTEPSDTALWRQAIAICESLTGLNQQQMIERLQSLQLEAPLSEKVMRMLENMSASDALLDEHDYQSVVAHLKGGQQLIGQQVEHYTIKRLVAQGGMSTVYEAELSQAQHQKSVAIKMLSPYGINEKAIELFNREQLILSQLSHPSIVSFHHSGVTDGGSHFLVMEYIKDAENIVEYCEKNDLSRSAVVEMVQQLCEVFSYAHAKQVIHRDIKPNNILVDSSGHIKVIDFGIGRFDQPKKHDTFTKVFTPDVAAPEQLLGQGISEQTDVFSLGALLLQLLVRSAPLPKTDVSKYQPQDDVKHINRLLSRSDLDHDLKNIVTTAMHIDVEKRYANMASFGKDLDHWLHHRPISAATDSWWYRIKKYYRRNQAFTLFLSLVAVVAFSTVVMISALESQKQQAMQQRDGSFALIKAMIDQANPVKNEGLADSDLLVKNLEGLANQQATLLNSDPQLSRFFYQELGSLYNSKGLYQEALDSYEKAFTASKKYLPPQHPDYLGIELIIAHLVETTGQYEQAKVLGYALLDKLDQLPDADPQYRLSAYDLLSKVHDYLFEIESAMQIGTEARIWMERHPDIDPDKQSSMYNSLAVMSRKTGDLAAAEQLYGQAIELIRNDPDKRIRLSSVLVNLAILKGRSGAYDESEQLFLEAIDVASDVDPQHPHVGMSYLPYATLLRVTGRYQESKSVSEKALVILLKNGEKPQRGQAYERLVRINMTLFEFDDVPKHLMAAKQLENPDWSLDHPTVLGRMTLVMWLVYAFNDQALIRQLTEYIDQQQLTQTVDTLEYKNYQVIRALAEQQPMFGDHDAALFTRLEVELAAFTPQQQQVHLSTYLEQIKANTITAAHVRLLLAERQQDQAVVGEVCQPSASWFGAYQVVLKFLVIQQCQQLQGDDLSPELVGYLQRWQDFHAHAQAELSELVQLYTSK